LHHICRLLALSALLPLLSTAPCLADDLYAEDRPHWRKNLFKRVVTDQKFLATTWMPYEARRPSFFIPLSLGALTAIGSNAERGGLDIELSSSIHDWTVDNGGSGFASSLSTLGDGATGMALVGSTYLIGRWSGNSRLARASSLSAEAMLNTGIWSTLLKSTTRRARPSSALYGGTFNAGGPGIEPTSFPSGHAMGAFAVATVFAHEYRERRWVVGLVYGSAGLIAFSRVGLGRHYVGDVVVGSVLGRSLGRMVVARDSGLEGGSFSDRFKPIFEPTRQRYGIQYSHSW